MSQPNPQRPDPDEPEPRGFDGSAYETDPGADTDSWRAFAEAGEPAEPSGSSTVFRLATLVLGLIAVAAVVWLLVQ